MLKRFKITSGILVFAVCFLCNCNGNDNGSAGSYSINDLKEIVKGLPEAQTSFDMTAQDFVAGIRIGWNLGNTMDAMGDTSEGFSWLGGGVYATTSVNDMERAWCGHITTQANITEIKSVGFNAVRIPVSWSKAVDNDYVIRSDWMNRVKQIVDYAVNENMYIIINTHHDEVLFKFTDAEKTESLKAFKKIWEQIADTFKDYNEKLIFEGLNEPRTKGSSAEWQGGTPSEHLVINEYYQVFVDTVRASGGNNNKRFLMVAPYAASTETLALNGLKLPVDTASNKLIVSVHAYPPYNFALNTNHAYNTWSSGNSSDTGGVKQPFDRAYNKFVSNGIPVIMGEFGAMNKNNESTRAEWGKYSLDYARQKGIPCFWWDNAGTTGSGELFGLLNRSNNTWHYPVLLAALMKGAGIVP